MNADANIDHGVLRKATVFWILSLLAPLPGLVMYIGWLWDLEQYGYILPLLAALVAFVFFRWDRVVRFPTHPISLALLAAGLLITGLAVAKNSPWLSAVGFVVIGFAWLHSHLSNSDDRQRLTYLGLLLIMLVRLPLNLDLSLAAYLQRFTSRISSHILDALGVANYLRGNVIDLPGGTLFVEEACSGVQSLFTVLFLVCLLIVFFRRPIATTPFYVLAAIGWAMTMNVVRITSIALFQEWYAIDLSKGVLHELLGWLCLLFAIMMLLSTDRLFRVAFYPVPATDTLRLGNPATRLWNRLLTFGTPELPRDQDDPVLANRLRGGLVSPLGAKALLGVALLFGIPSVALGSKALIDSFAAIEHAASDELLWEPPPDLFFDSVWSSNVVDHAVLRGNYRKQLGANSDAWTIDLDGMIMRVAVSQPYPEWHDMCLCYEGSGWQKNDYVADVNPERGPDNWGLSRAEFVRDSGGFGHLLFSGFDSQGNLVQPVSGIRSVFAERRKDRSVMSYDIIMLQLWAETQTPLLPEQMAKIERFFRDFRSLARKQIGSGTESVVGAKDEAQQ